MKRVLVFGMTNNPGGVENFILNYCRNMSKRIQFDFLTYDVQPAFEKEIKEELNGDIYVVTGKRKNIIKNRKELKAFFRENSKKYDAIWVNLCELSSIEPLKYAKKYGIQQRIIHSHNSQNMSNLAARILHSINKQLLTMWANTFWACSMNAGEFFYKNDICKSDQYSVIRNAIDVDRFKFSDKKRKSVRERLGVSEKIVIGHVGRLHPQKNPIFIVEILEKVVEMNRNVELLWIGTGSMLDQVQTAINKKGIGEYISLLGTRKDIPDLMCAMDVFLLPSLYEGFPVVLVEAQASGLPIVVSDSVTKEVALGGGCSFLSLEENADKWAEKILEIVQVKNERVNDSALVKEAGYDIHEETSKVMKKLGVQDEEEN